MQRRIWLGTTCESNIFIICHSEECGTHDVGVSALDICAVFGKRDSRVAFRKNAPQNDRRKIAALLLWSDKLRDYFLCLSLRGAAGDVAIWLWTMCVVDMSAMSFRAKREICVRCAWTTITHALSCRTKVRHLCEIWPLDEFYIPQILHFVQNDKAVQSTSHIVPTQILTSACGLLRMTER